MHNQRPTAEVLSLCTVCISKLFVFFVHPSIRKSRPLYFSGDSVALLPIVLVPVNLTIYLNNVLTDSGSVCALLLLK